MTMILDGSAGVTFPNGTNPQAAPSKLLQVVNSFVSGSSASTSSSTFVTTGFSASITPLFSTSKILIMASSAIYSDTTSSEPHVTVYRGGTNIGGTTGMTDMFSAANRLTVPFGFSLLDSPATTSSTTYTLYFNITGGGNTTIGVNGTSISITLMEIAA